jgi:hypothetical protein
MAKRIATGVGRHWLTGSVRSRAVHIAAGIVVITFIAGWGARGARAGLIFVSQQRGVTASALGSSQSFTASDFGPFDRSAFASSTMGQGSTGEASHQSALEPATISLSGFTRAHGTSGFASSVLDVVFDVAAETVPFQLTGLGSGSSGLPELHSTISLKRDATTLVQWQASMDTPDPLNFSGELEPGRYTLNAAFSAANAPGFTATNAYAVNLVIPEPAGLAGTAALTGVLLRRLRRR